MKLTALSFFNYTDENHMPDCIISFNGRHNSYSFTFQLIRIINKQFIMAIKITEECINCGACEPECPNNAIYEGGVEWAIADGTTVTGSFVLIDGTVVDANTRMPALSTDIYYITPNKCTECQGFHEEPQCASVCPVDCCVPDEDYKETVDQLMKKKQLLHA